MSSCSAILERVQVISNEIMMMMMMMMMIHASLDVYSSILLEQQTAGRHVAPFGHIILIRANQSYLLLIKDACLVKKQKLPIL